MLNQRKKGNGLEYIDVVQNAGNTDYVLDGAVVKNAPMKIVLVTSKAQAEALLSEYDPGTIAYTAGFLQMWQKAADGTWADFYSGG